MTDGRELRGRNIHGMHLKVARLLSRRISGDPKVTGIIFLGGLVRGFADEYSDIDIVVITRRRDARLKKALEGMGRSAGASASVDVDLEVHSLKDFANLETTDWRRWEYSSAKVILDRGGGVKRAISELTTVPDSYWTDRIVESWTYLQWYGCPAKGCKSIAEIWCERGDPASGHHCVNYALDLLMSILFSLNREFVPAPKWRASCMHELAWKPKGLESVLEQALVVRALSGSDVRRRVNLLTKLHRQLDAKALETTGMSREKFVRYFVQKAVFEMG